MNKKSLQKIRLLDSKGKLFFNINLKPNFSFLDKQIMFSELEGNIKSINPSNKKNLRLFCENIIRYCDNN
jgi:hypothetical protein